MTTLRYTNDPQSTPGVDTYYDGYRANNYTNINNVKGQAWQSETIDQVRFTIDNYDVMGRPTIQRQQFRWNNAWSGSYRVSVNYDLSGGLTSQSYPSGNTATYDYDKLGRLQTFSGNLGGGASRIYANNFQYNDYGLLQQEQFGTQTALYHKQRFNGRGQLWDMRLSTVSFDSDPANGDRGSIINYFSGSYTQGGSGADNNGNLLRQEIYVPGGPYFQQTYAYDNLNRLTSVSEKLNGTGTDSFKQIYTYDRWGNLSVNTALSSSTVPRPAYTVDSNTNRLIAPAGANYGYDSAGNQTNDTYTGGGQRTFDSENHMLSAQESTGWQSYKYSGSGLRVRRIVNGVEIWQVYDFSGALLAEYPANGAVANPQMEYGYRNGQLLVTAESATATNLTWTNVTGVSVNGNSLTKTAGTGWGNAGASSTQSIIAGDGYVEVTATETSTARLVGFSHTDTDQSWPSIDFGIDLDLSGAIYVFESGTNRGNFGPYATGDKFQVAIVGGVVKYKKNGTVFYTSSVTPTYPLVVDTALHGNGCTLSNVVFSGPLTTQNVSWTNTTGLSVSGNNLTKTASTGWGNAGAASTQSIVSGDGYVEVTASETNSPRIFGLSDTDVDQSWASIDFGFELDFNGAVYIFESGNNRGSFGTFATGDKLQVAIVGGVVKYKKNGTVIYTSSVTPTYPLMVDTALYSVNCTLNNVVIASANTSGASPTVKWLVADQLGTPRMVVDQTGAMASVKRHDYLPFGEEIGGPQVGLIGGRTGTMGYGADAIRQKFTGYQFDAETGLNYAQARYQSSVQGRFTSVDPLGASADIGDPQSFNRYSYVQNMPLTAVDPSGMALSDMGVYQTNDPYVADQLYKNSLPRPQQHAKNAPLPRPRPVQMATTTANLPPPPGGPVSTKIPMIDVGEPPLPAGQGVDLRKDPNITAAIAEQKGSPLPQGVRPQLTRVVTVLGQSNEVTNGFLIDAYGNKYPFSGVVRPVGIIPLDQNGNIIPPGNGVALNEAVAGSDDVTQSGQAYSPPGGVFIDIQSVPFGRVEKVVQAISVHQGATLFRIAKNTIVKDGVGKLVTVHLAQPVKER